MTKLEKFYSIIEKSREGGVRRYGLTIVLTYPVFGSVPVIICIDLAL